MLVRQKEHEILELKSAAMSVGAVDYAKDRVTTSAAGDAAFVAQVQRWMEWEREAMAARAEYIEAMRKITAEIDALSNPRHVDVLYRFYVVSQPLWLISKETHYSYSDVRRTHCRALKAFAQKYQLDTK